MSEDKDKSDPTIFCSCGAYVQMIPYEGEDNKKVYHCIQCGAVVKTRKKKKIFVFGNNHKEVLEVTRGLSDEKQDISYKEFVITFFNKWWIAIILGIISSIISGFLVSQF